MLLSLVVTIYIYQCRCKGNILNKNGLIQNIESVRKIEVGIATRKGENAIKTYIIGASGYGWIDKYAKTIK